MAGADRTVRESVQPLDQVNYLHDRLAVAATPENIWTGPEGGVMSEARSIDIVTDLDVLIAFNITTGALTAGTNALFLNAGESLTLEGKVITALRIVNVNVGERPLIRGTIWGVSGAYN